MSFAVRSAWPDDLDRIVELAVQCQGDPERSCAYLSSEQGSFRDELTAIDGAENWTDVCWVALDDRRELLGWIAAETDIDMGRLWWFGPFVVEGAGDEVLDALLAAGRRQLSNYGEEEVVADSRSGLIGRFARRNGFAAGEPSAVLKLHGDVLADELASLDQRYGQRSVQIVRAADADPDQLAAACQLHDETFPGTHSTGERIFGHVDDTLDRFIALDGGVVVGYVATEMQPDGSLYVDYLGVAPDTRGRGLGGAMVARALVERQGAYAHAHLTVRADNVEARRLYRRLGFVDDVILVPYRLGFSVGG